MKQIVTKLDKTLGYLYFIDKGNPCAGTSGKVYYHRWVWYCSFGVIPEGFHIHHKDGDKLNNRISNLECLSPSEHAKEHRGVERVDVACGVCSMVFTTNLQNTPRLYCSNGCRATASRKFEVSKEELERLVWKYPTTKVSKMFGVSDVAISKRCKRLGIPKPPRGYWTKN